MGVGVVVLSLFSLATTVRQFKVTSLFHGHVI